MNQKILHAINPVAQSTPQSLPLYDTNITLKK